MYTTTTHNAYAVLGSTPGTEHMTLPYELMHVANAPSTSSYTSIDRDGNSFTLTYSIPQRAYDFDHAPFFDDSDWVETTIPFDGFYQSCHEGNIDHAVEQALSDENGDVFQNADGSSYLTHHAYDSGWEISKITIPYAQWYMRAVAEKLSEVVGGAPITLRFDEMTSPSEYNFTTDRIFVKMPPADFLRLAEATETLEDKARERFTSCDGFISHYSNDVLDWGAVDEWDHNQRGTVLEALLDEHDVEQLELVEDIDRNGELSDWVWEALPDRVKKIAEYLRSREERARIAKQAARMAG